MSITGMFEPMVLSYLKLLCNIFFIDIPKLSETNIFVSVAQYME